MKQSSILKNIFRILNNYLKNVLLFFEISQVLSFAIRYTHPILTLVILRCIRYVYYLHIIYVHLSLNFTQVHQQEKASQVASVQQAATAAAEGTVLLQIRMLDGKSNKYTFKGKISYQLPQLGYTHSSHTVLSPSTIKQPGHICKHFLFTICSNTDIKYFVQVVIPCPPSSLDFALNYILIVHRYKS